MNNQLTTQNKPTQLTPEEQAMMLNDLSKLQPAQRSSLYAKVCESVGLNPLTQPFQYLELNGKLTLYASRNCTDQLRAINNVSVTIASREKHEGLYVVTAKATLPSGRTDESIAAVDLTEPDKVQQWQNRQKKWAANPRAGKQLQGDALANSIMKAETKAKRRVTLSICGLSFMDETEIETVRGARVVNIEKVQAELPSPEREPEPPREVQPEVEQPQNSPPPSFDERDPIDEFIGPADKAKQGLKDYRIPFGKYTGQSLDDVGLQQLEKYAQWIVNKAREDNKPLRGSVQELIDMITHYEQEMSDGNQAFKDYQQNKSETPREFAPGQY